MLKAVVVQKENAVEGAQPAKVGTKKAGFGASTWQKSNDAGEVDLEAGTVSPAGEWR